MRDQLMKHEQPPTELGWYHLPWLLDAEAGTLTFNRDRYRVHGVSNNAADAERRGLLAFGPDGMVLTDLGRTMLADWKASPKGQKWLADWDLDNEDSGQTGATQLTSAPAAAASNEQLGLFTEVA